MFRVSQPTLHAPVNISEVHLTTSKFQLKLADFALHSLLRGSPNLAHNFARFRQIGMEAKVVYTISEREYLRLIIQFESKPRQMFTNVRQTLLQMGFVRMDEHEIVHITRVPTDVQLFFDHAVHTVQIKDGEPLRSHVADGDADVACR